MADAKLEVILSAKNLAKKGFDDFEAQAKRTAKEVNGTFTQAASVIKNAIGGIALGAIAAGWVREVNAAGNAYFQMSQTFQGQTDAMVAAARQMAEDFNQFYNFNEIAYAFTKTADSMERYGITGDRYLKLVGRAAEVGAAKNLELKESIDRIESAIRGEAEASEYLGLTLNDTYMKNQAFGGSLKDTWEKLSDNEKALYRYNELMLQSAKYAGSTEAAVNTLGGAWNRLTNTLLGRGLDALMQQNSILARGLNLVTDFVEALGKYNDRVTETIDRVERGLAKTGVRTFKIPQQESRLPQLPGAAASFVADIYGPAPAPVGGGGGGSGSAKKPAGISSSRMAYLEFQASQMRPDWFMGMAEANERALEEVTDAATISYETMAVESQTWVDGAIAGLAEYHAAASDTFQGASDFFGQSMSTMEDALVDFVATGKLEWRGLIDSILQDMARLVIRQNITGPLSNLLSMGISSLFGAGSAGSGFHVNQTAGGTTTAFGFADGGISSGPSTGYLATLHGREAVIPLPDGRGVPVEMKGGGGNVTNNYYIAALDVKSFEDRFGPSVRKITADGFSENDPSLWRAIGRR